MTDMWQTISQQFYAAVLKFDDRKKRVSIKKSVTSVIVTSPFVGRGLALCGIQKV